MSVMKVWAAVAGVVVVAACGTAEGAGGGGGLPAYQESGPTTSPSESAAAADIGGAGAVEVTDLPDITIPPDTEVDPYLKGISLTTKDVDHLGLVVEPTDDPASLDYVTVDICEELGSASEKKRVARYGVDIPSRVAVTGDGTEYVFEDPELESSVTVYDSVASAEQAMAEWRAGMARIDECEDPWRALIPDLSLEGWIVRSDAALPIADNFTVQVKTVQAGKGEVARAFDFYQRHGNLIANVSYPGGNVHDYEVVRQVAVTLGNRILETPRR